MSRKEINSNNPKATEMSLLNQQEAEEYVPTESQEDLQCGVGNCKTYTCANMNAFTANLSVIILCQIAIFTYVYTCI